MAESRGFSDRPSVRRQIVRFHLDDENHWVADLDCGHSQHVRHEPPLVQRPWVLTDEGRRSHLGTELDCVRCAELDGDLQAAIARRFPSEEQQEVRALLMSYGNERWHREVDRVRRVLVQSAGGSLARLRPLVAMAKVDYRDVLVRDSREPWP